MITAITIHKADYTAVFSRVEAAQEYWDRQAWTVRHYPAGADVQETGDGDTRAITVDGNPYMDMRPVSASEMARNRTLQQAAIMAHGEIFIAAILKNPAWKLRMLEMKFPDAEQFGYWD